jgi:mannose-1-phosphate guanylyltransferase
VSNRNAKDVYAVILVGGKGKRLMPLSTDARPKAFLSVKHNGVTMFGDTLARIGRLVGEDNIMVVANAAHSKLVRIDFPGVRRGNLLLEPVSRNTAPAIALAAHAIKKRFGDGVMVVLPSDQYIIGDREYLGAVKKGINFIRKNQDAIVVLGVKPASPSTQLGYIKAQGSGCKAQNVYKVTKFEEKPDIKTAKRYLQSGQYLWNSGAFIFTAGSILNNIKRFAPRISEVLNKGTKHYRDMPDISIDYAVMEKAGNIYCVTGSYGWNDMGSFDSLISVMRRERRNFVFEDGKVTAIL